MRRRRKRGRFSRAPIRRPKAPTRQRGASWKIICDEYQPQHRTRQPLGEWTDDDDDWEWYITANGKSLFRRHQGNWSRHRLKRRGRPRRDGGKLFSPYGRPIDAPQGDLYRTKVLYHDRSLKPTGRAQASGENNGNQEQGTLGHRFKKGHPSRVWATKNNRNGDDGLMAAAAIEAGVALAVSDGSYAEETGQLSAAFRITIDKSALRIPISKDAEIEGRPSKHHQPPPLETDVRANWDGRG